MRMIILWEASQQFPLMRSRLESRPLLLQIGLKWSQIGLPLIGLWDLLLNPGPYVWKLASNDHKSDLSPCPHPKIGQNLGPYTTLPLPNRSQLIKNRHIVASNPSPKIGQRNAKNKHKIASKWCKIAQMTLNSGPPHKRPKMIQNRPWIQAWPK